VQKLTDAGNFTQIQFFPWFRAFRLVIRNTQYITEQFSHIDTLYTVSPECCTAADFSKINNKFAMRPY